jgi:hypothetical protein
MNHLCDTCKHDIPTCKGDPLFGIDHYGSEVAFTAKADEVVKCDCYEEAHDGK